MQRFLILGSDVTEFRILSVYSHGIIILSARYVISVGFGGCAKFEMKQLSLKRTRDRKQLQRRGSCTPVYIPDCLYPPGIMNVANNCYASSIVQCLINHPSFSLMYEKLIGRHAMHCDKTCTSSSKRFMKLYTFIHSFMHAWASQSIS